MKKVNVTEKFKFFNEYWPPRIIGDLNGQYVKLAKLKGEFMWHSHANEDEFYIILKGVKHKPVADEEAHNELIGHRRSLLGFKAYKLYCYDCKRYGNQQFPGINKHQRTTWRAQEAVFHEHTRGGKKLFQSVIRKGKPL